MISSLKYRMLGKDAMIKKYLEYLIGRKKPGIKFRRYKKLSVKNFVTGKMIRHFLWANFFAWLSENN